ncbi:zinc-ribbon domain-containing protein [Thermoplasmatales archaeon AK]|nr:zinc-ribbon domain-containing protein [Thermoplasmatales archaeon AK]
MPVYEVDEHELLKEDCTLVDGDAEIQDGTLYLTDKRLIYEKKGKRGFLRATPPKIYMDLHLYELKNVSAAVPKLKLFTKKLLSVEFEKDGQPRKYDFVLSNPKQWSDEITRWIADARRHREEEERRAQEERHKREVELANAKSTKQNIGMAYFGSDSTQRGQRKAGPKHVDIEEEQEVRASQSLEEPKYIPVICENCGMEVSPDMNFCPNCGHRITKDKVSKEKTQS